MGADDKHGQKFEEEASITPMTSTYVATPGSIEVDKHHSRLLLESCYVDITAHYIPFGNRFFRLSVAMQFSSSTVQLQSSDNLCAWFTNKHPIPDGASTIRPYPTVTVYSQYSGFVSTIRGRLTLSTRNVTQLCPPESP